MFHWVLNMHLDTEIYFSSPIFNISKPCILMKKKVCGDHTPNFFFAKPEYDKGVLFISGADFV